jgi:hypothetical protein
VRRLVRVLATVVPALHRWLVRRPAAELEEAEDGENVYPLW